MSQTLSKLTPKQRLFVEAYCGVAQGNASKAHRLAGYENRNHANEAYILMHTPKIIDAIEEFKLLTRRQFWIDTSEILEGIYKEAKNTEDGTQQGRIQAWVWLGKHVGMFQEKKEDKSGQQITYNIVNYSDEGQLKEKIEVGVKENKQEILEHKEEEVVVQLPIDIKDYSEIKNDSNE
jgi:hypothetical protein